MSDICSSTQSPGSLAVVDAGYDGLDPLEVLGILGDVRTRRHQLGDERDPLSELRVLFQEDVKGAETTQHVLTQVGTVDPQDQVISAAAKQLLLELPHPGPPGDG